jgi:hypothetical protein
MTASSTFSSLIEAQIANEDRRRSHLEEIAEIEREDRLLAHLQEEDFEPAGFERITRTRPSRRPGGAERVRQETRRPKREGKW